MPFNAGPHGRYDPLPPSIATVPGWMDGETFRYLHNYDELYLEDFYDVIKSFECESDIYYLYHRPKLHPEKWSLYSEYYKVYHLDHAGNQQHLGFIYVGQNWDTQEPIEGYWLVDYLISNIETYPSLYEATFSLHKSYQVARRAEG